MIPVTKPFSPPREEYLKELEGIWKRNWFTNNGPLVNDLELKLKRYLETPHLLYVSNGTIAIQLALNALNITKKVITTPFSYVATTSSLVWEGCKPVFADIDPDSFNIDPSKIEALIDEDTEAILATHCFGVPCDIEAIEVIANKYSLKVIYDAAHCFGTTYKGQSIFNFGDICTTSFHATKIFHSVEGGAVFTRNPDLLKRMAYMRNFGHDGPEKFNGVGINGKNSEFHAAMGIVNLKHISEVLSKRKSQYSNYQELLANTDLRFQDITNISGTNYSYFPILFNNEDQLLEIKDLLEKNNIYPRRYFYPLLSDLDYTNKTFNQTPKAHEVSSNILCLPLFHDLSFEEQEMISRLIKRGLNN